MPLWTKTRAPQWAPTAVQTDRGWTDPVTGEVYVTIGGLASLAGAAIQRIRTTASAYRKSVVITTKVYFSEAVTVTGTPQLTLKFNNQSRTASYSAGSGTAVLSFTYTTQAGDDAALGEMTATSPLALNSGTIVDGGSADATLTFATTAYTKDDDHFAGYALSKVVVDATPPTLGSAALVSSAHGTHPVTGDVLTLTLTASEAVVVVGSPQVALAINLTTRQMVYDSASSTSTSLKFKYTVVGGDAATAGQLSVSTLGLNGGTIKDAALNAATLTFVAPTTTAWAVN